MTTKAKTRRGVADGSQQVLFGGGTDTTVPRLPIVRPIALATRGRVEFTGRCPGCDAWHRHIHLGKVTGPCGASYDLRPRGMRSGGTR
jgi:hypothetical protein